ncbi:MAG TPA: hypothetical protein VNM90_10775 [Haliangium sp.]|nr:hypothetical protein [Haliangium sp.]
MPAKWSNKDERQYEHIKESSEERGVPAKRAKEIAARTVNKNRRKQGRTPNKRTQGTGNPNRSLEEHTRDELYNMARDKNIPKRSAMSKGQLINALKRR